MLSVWQLYIAIATSSQWNHVKYKRAKPALIKGFWGEVKVKSADEPSGPSGRLLSPVSMKHEATTNISSPPVGLDVGLLQSYPLHRMYHFLYTCVKRGNVSFPRTERDVPSPARGPFLEGPKKFSHPKSRSKISNLMTSELLISTEVVFIQEVSGVHTSLPLNTD